MKLIIVDRAKPDVYEGDIVIISPAEGCARPLDRG
jgi:hypothetical protein